MILEAAMNESKMAPENLPVFWEACKAGNIEQLEALLAAGQLGEVDADRGISSACRNGHTSACRFMLEHGARVKQFDVCNAAYHGHIKLLRLFEEYGWDFNEWAPVVIWIRIMARH